jgi:tRNA threonylcarbamoyl adenosine modification protein YjeE
MTSAFEKQFHLVGEAQTEALARRISLWARPGLLIALHGDVGAGKSTFARAFIQALFKPGFDSDVPSPTFSLIQTYDETRIPVFHADLYRVNNADEVSELGLDDLLQTHIGLIEWPERLSGPLTEDVLLVNLSGTGNGRDVTLKAGGRWAAVLARDAVIEDFLKQHNIESSSRIFFEGDASSRRYETVLHNSERILLMDMPLRPDGPPVKNGKPYSQIAHLAEDITAVVAINKHLVDLGFSAPRIFGADIAKGLALIEPLGDRVYGRMMLAGEDMREPMLQAASLLAEMATHEWPSRPVATAENTHALKHYDEDAMLIEVDLLPSWFYRHVHGVAAHESMNESFSEVWRTILPLVKSERPQWVLRDFHSPNLIWIPERQGTKRVGLIDTQDAVLGHPAYDLMSMAQDARVDVSAEMEKLLVEHYCSERHKQGPFDEASFRAAYAVLGAQRATKILGIFARLNMRDSKPAYLKHMPRVSRYLARNLEHPSLQPLKDWYLANLPEALSVDLAVKA